MQRKEEVYVETLSDESYRASTNLVEVISDLDGQIKMLSSQADHLDCLVAIASGVLCGMLDIFWCGEFDLSRGRNFSSDEVERFVKRIAKLMGCEKEDLKGCVAYLEKMFPVPNDGNTPDFGGGLQHHLRDFGHHPTVIGLLFSLLTQFTGMSYGTDTVGKFIVVPVPDKSKVFIGKDVPDKIVKGTVIWFFHLVSDIAGSSNTAGLSGGTGIPGPILSMAKELAALPPFHDMTIGDETVSKILSQMFNGTLFAKRDANGKIIKETIVKFDFRGELGAAAELGRLSIPVVANECIVRCFYFIRRMTEEMKQHKIRKWSDLAILDWNRLKPEDNPTITRMLTISTGVFSLVDVTEAVVGQKYWIAVNYVGVGRFAVAIGKETFGILKARDVKRIKAMYEKIDLNTTTAIDSKIYGRIRESMDFDRLGLTYEQVEILYNLEYLKTQNDICMTTVPIGKETLRALKSEWLAEWKSYMEKGFPAFVQMEEAELHWYTEEELVKMIEAGKPGATWLKLVLLEAMLFEPYFVLSIEKNKKGEDVPSKKYDKLHAPVGGYSKSDGDKFLDGFLQGEYYQKGFIKRLRKCYDKVCRELNEVLKTAITSIAVTASIAVATVAAAGAFAPAIAVALVGSNFAGLSGAALTSASLAYLGGGAIAAGGLGMAGGTMAVVGGGAVLGLGVGAGVGGVVGAAGVMGKKNTILQSAKLLVSVREIFLNDEHDLEYSNSIYEQYVQNVVDIEKGIAEMKVKADVAAKEEKKRLRAQIKNAEESVGAMRIAMKSMNKYKSAFEAGLTVE